MYSSNILTGFIRELGTNIDLNRQDSIHRRLDQIARQFHRLPSLGSTLTDQVNTVLRLLDSLVEAYQTVGYSSYISEHFHSGERGRPIFHIGKEQLEYFLQHGFTGPDIAAMLGVSLRTVRRRISNFGLSIRGLYLSDVELDPLVTEICSAFLI